MFYIVIIIIIQYPDICKKFYELLHYVCEIFPESLLTLPTDAIQYIFTLIGLGCVRFVILKLVNEWFFNCRFGTDITVLSVECIESLSNCSPTVNLDLFVQGLKFFLKVCAHLHVHSLLMCLISIGVI